MIESAPVATTTPAVCQQEDMLHIPAGGVAQTIYISVVVTGTTLVSGFSLKPTDPPCTGGMIWGVEPEYGLFLNFVFLPSASGTILGVENETLPQGMWASHTVIPTPLGGFNQQACVRNAADTYSFFVDIQPKLGELIRHDPRIIVTPLM